MPAERTRPRPSQPAIQLRERRLAGDAIGLPMIGFIAATDGFEAGRVSWHSHRQFEVLMALRGATEYEFRNGGRAALAGDHFLVVPPRMVHRAARDVREPTVICAISFDANAASPGRGPFTKKELVWMGERLGSTRPVARPMNARLRRMAHAFHQAVRSHPVVKPPLDALAAMRLQAAALLLEITRHSGESSGNPTAKAIALAVDHMERNYADGLQMDDVAEAADCSRSRLFALFKRETGMSPNDWLQRLRVKKAVELLTATNRPLVDIALSVGFASQQYFCHVFRKYTGKTPGEYRQKQRGGDAG